MKKLFLLTIAILLMPWVCWAEYTSVYPPAQSDTYVKATTKYSTGFWPHYATDPTKSLTGVSTESAWAASSGSVTNQRFHIDLGSAKAITRIYYENYHSYGGAASVIQGVQNFTFWGSNTAGDFADLTYANDGTWVEIIPSQSSFDKHVTSDVSDPKYITVSNSIPYRYYAFKFVDGWGAVTQIGVRRIELQEGSPPVFGIDNYTKLMLHMDGTDDAQVFTDSSYSNHTVTAVGNVKTENTNKKFGVTSGYFDPDGDGLEVTDSADWDLPSDFTIDAWVNTTEKTSSRGDDRRIVHFGALNEKSLIAMISSVSGAINIYIDNAYRITGTTDITDGVWHHIAISRSGADLRLFVDGVQDGSTATYSESLISTQFLIGTASIAGWGAGWFNGYIDELRISKGIARWTSNFTPPDRAYYQPTLSGVTLSGVSIPPEPPTFRFEVTTAGADTFQLPIYNGGTYDFYVDWGDGTAVDHITAYNDAAANHSYAGAGTYDVAITGTITGWRFAGAGDRTLLTAINEWGPLKLGNANGYFNGCSNLVTVDTPDALNLDGTTNFTVAFKDCSKLTTLDVGNWDTSTITNFYFAFHSCSELTALDVSNWDTSAVTNFGSTFYGCSKLTTIDISNWDTSAVTNFSSVFSGCSSLTTLDVSGWDTGLVTTFQIAFHNCSSLTTLNVSGWDTSAVTNFYFAFHSCSSLTTLDTSNWDTSAVVSFGSTFYNCSSLTNLDPSGFDIEALDGTADLTNFATGVTMSTAVYDATLIAWAAQTVLSGMSPNFGNSKYTAGGAAEAARTSLINDDSWTITDGGIAP